MSGVRRSKRSRRVIHDDDDDDDDNDNDRITTTPSPSKQKPKRRISSQPQPSPSPRTQSSSYASSSSPLPSSQEQEQPPVIFSQLATLEHSQSLPKARTSERRNLQNLNATKLNAAVTSLSRLLLFKALAGEPIDRTKDMKAAADPSPNDGTTESISNPLADIRDERCTNAVFEKANQRLLDVFGFDIVSIPDFMSGGNLLGSKYNDRYYVINRVADPDGQHSRCLHDNNESGERGLLMVVLALAYCRGDVMPGGAGQHRWIGERALYRLLHMVDENLPDEPPEVVGGKSSARQRRRRRGGADDDGMTIDVDASLERFVHMDYLLKQKTRGSGAGEEAAEGAETIMYAMGPRAALEIGRRQLVHFCAELLDEQPDPTMLAEIDDELCEDGEVEEEEEEG